MNNPKVFFDLDDVLADFTGYVNNNLATDFSIGDDMGQENWSEIREYHQRIFLKLNLIDEVSFLMNKVRLKIGAENVRILTAIPVDPESKWQYASYDKVVWAHKNVPGVPVIFGPYAHHKWKHCNPGDHLIDDKISNCVDWANNRGIAHIYRTPAGLHNYLTRHNLI